MVAILNGAKCASVILKSSRPLLPLLADLHYNVNIRSHVDFLHYSIYLGGVGVGGVLKCNSSFLKTNIKVIFLSKDWISGCLNMY